MSKKYFDRIDKEWYEEEQLRRIYLENEVEDIKQHLPLYIDRLLSVDMQCEYIKLATNGPIGAIVDKLNLNWNYELVSEDKYYMEEYTFLSSKVGDLEKQLEETKNKIKDVQNNINRLEKENK